MLEFLIGSFLPVFSHFFNTSLCVMVSVIITSERRFALSSKVVKQVLCDIYVLDRGTSAPR